MRFYVCKTWHDFPEGGTFSGIFTATSREEASQQCDLAMATLGGYWGFDCPECGWQGSEDAPGPCPTCGRVMIPRPDPDYADSWYTIDCYPLEDSTEGLLLARIIEAYEGPLIEEAKEYLYGR